MNSNGLLWKIIPGENHEDRDFMAYVQSWLFLSTKQIAHNLGQAWSVSSTDSEALIRVNLLESHFVASLRCVICFQVCLRPALTLLPRFGIHFSHHLQGVWRKSSVRPNINSHRGCGEYAGFCCPLWRGHRSYACKFHRKTERRTVHWEFFEK
jgi:hypothetical protein